MPAAEWGVRDEAWRIEVQVLRTVQRKRGPELEQAGPCPPFPACFVLFGDALTTVAQASC